MKDHLLPIRTGQKLTVREEIMLTLRLSLPAILAQISSIIMQYAEIRKLGATILRIEAFAEPLYGASIVAAGVFRGAGETLMSSVLNLMSVWLVRIPLAYYLGSIYGLKGAWIAMCSELCVRGTLFLIRLVLWKPQRTTVK